MTVTASVLSYNSHATLPRVIEGIESQTRPPDRVVIVDNGSDQETLQYLQQLPPRYEVIYLPENLGLGAGHNTGWRTALEAPDCDYVWTLENDSIPPETCLEGLLNSADHLIANGLTFGAICPRQSHPESPKSPRQEAPQITTKMTFNGTLIPCSSIQEVGFLREDFFIDQDDWEFAYRLVAAGRPTYVDPKTQIIHLGKGKDTNSVLRLYYRVRNAAYLRRHVREQSFSTLNAIVRCLGSSVRVVLSEDTKWRRIKARFVGTWDGLRGNLGKKSYRFLDG